MNGKLNPAATMKPGQMQRWKIVNAAMRVSTHGTVRRRSA